MTALSDLFSHEDFTAALDKGYVSAQTHPTLPLVIYNYTPAAQYERYWTPVTVACRGLITDVDGNIVARPFQKFFNYGETDQYDSLPSGDPVVSEKMDGSLGIIYSYNGVPRVATRGSFTSDQAQWATKWLWENLRTFEQPHGVTTLVEIIYPGNRIVVDYKDREGLVLLGAIDNATGADIDPFEINWWGGEAAMHLADVRSVDDAIFVATSALFEEDEGVVLTWLRPDAPSFRLKVKHPRYIELHRIVTNLSTRSVHEALSTGTFDDLIAVTPDEFHLWVQGVAARLEKQFDDIMSTVEWDLFDARIVASLEVPVGEDYTRKDLAAAVVANAKYPGLAFALEDGKDIAPRIWDMIKPTREMAVIEV